MHDRAHARRVDVDLAQQAHAALRRARHEHRPALREVAEARRGEAVDVLRRIERADHRVAVEVLRQRHLDEDAVDVGSALSCATSAISSACVVVAGSL